MNVRAIVLLSMILTATLLSGCGLSSSSDVPLGSGGVRDDGTIDYAGWTAVTVEPIRVPEQLFFRCRVDPQVEEGMKKRGPHFVPAVKVYANPVALDPLRSGSTAMPVGSVVVKEKWWNDKDKQPHNYAAMVKREDGYDPANGNWEYIFVQSEGERKVERGRIESCIACHRTASRDYLFRSYLDANRPESK